MNGFQPPMPWYKTKAGIIFLIILGLIFLGFLWFGGLVGYYAYQIANGNGAELEEQFRSAQFTLDGSIQTSGSQIELKDVNSIIYKETAVIGSPNAPVTIVAFIDFECPFCQAAYQTFRQMTETYNPVVRVVYKQFPLTSIHPLSAQAAEAAACAQEQHAFLEYYNILFERKVLSRPALSAYAEELGLSSIQFEQCMQDHRYQSSIERDLSDGVSLGTRGTPTYFVNGKKIEGNITRSEWDTIILREIE